MTIATPPSAGHPTERTAPPSASRKLAAFRPIAVDVLLPTAVYFVLHGLGMRAVWALTLSGVAGGLSTAWTTVRRRRLDGIGLLVVAEIALTVVLLFVTNDPRMVLLKPSFYTLLTALYFFASCFVGRPVVYEAVTPMATDGDPVRLAAYREAWECSPLFRQRERLITGAFGAALALEAVLRAVVVFHYPVDRVNTALVMAQVPGVALIAAALLFTKAQVPTISGIVDGIQARLQAEAQQAGLARPAP